jgi:hypothetical protein
MGSLRIAAAWLLCAATPCAYSQSAAVAPSPAETFDNLSLEFDAGAPICPFVMSDGLRMFGQVIQVYYQRAGDCGFGPFATFRLTLGRFPAGDYDVEVYEAPPNGSLAPIRRVAIAAFHVNAYGKTTDAQAKPAENYTGHWTTPFYGEAVTATQFGRKIFVTWLTYAADGRPTWYVIPDGVYQYRQNSGSRFAGTLYSTQGIPNPQAAFAVFGNATPVGTGFFQDYGTDSAHLELHFNDGTTVMRDLQRLLF